FFSRDVVWMKATIDTHFLGHVDVFDYKKALDVSELRNGDEMSLLGHSVVPKLADDQDVSLMIPEIIQGEFVGSQQASESHSVLVSLQRVMLFFKFYV